ncbi:MAG: response regulator [Hyphomicrobium sp.]|uniref:response regulator n=1 Tax=Hyphomicrobium sp. TaxID=82 RepID=UPI003D0DBBA9
MTTTRPSTSLPDRPRATALVVEDDPILRFALSMELSEAGLAVREAVNADEAETVLATGAAVDIVVTDIEMPGVHDGLALAKFVRAFHPRVPVIVVSGIPPPYGIVGVADAFFGKPYDFDRIVLRVRALLGPRLKLAGGR